MTSADRAREPGFLVSELRSQYPCSDHWKIYTGCTVARVIEEIGNDIDFVILDAAHILPGEVLDFLTVLPYLSNNATVVLHDVLAATRGVAADWYATGVLYSSVVANKYSLIRDFPGPLYGSICNIGAFQINEDTKKYIENLFLLLYLPWPSIPASKHFEDYITILKRHYSEDLCNLVSVLYNREINANALPSFHCNFKALLALRKNADATIAIWGARGLGYQLYSYINSYNWSVTAREGKEPFNGMLGKLYASMYFIDSYKSQLEKDEFAQGLPLRDKSLLTKDKNLKAVIIGTSRVNARIEILSELQQMNIPDDKIHFVEEFIEN